MIGVAQCSRARTVNVRRQAADTSDSVPSHYRTQSVQQFGGCNSADADGIPMFVITPAVCACARRSVGCHRRLTAQCASRRRSAGMVLSRARSWPLLSPPPAPPPPRATSAAVVPSSSSQTRRLLWRHYYPEGGWGWVVVGCSVGVHVLNHGLQLGGGAVLLSAAVTTFHISATDAGTWHVGRETHVRSV
jgi:hypothetical protein